jgi:hypothetical protein
MTGVRRMLAFGLVLSLVFVMVGVIWLSNSVETLDEVAEHFGATESPIWTPPIPNYEIHGFEGNVMANIAVGIVFAIIVLVSTFAVGKSLQLLKSRA